MPLFLCVNLRDVPHRLVVRIAGSLQPNADFFYGNEVGRNHHHHGDKPAHRIYRHQCVPGVGVPKDGVHPQNSGSADADKSNRRRNHRDSVTPHRSGKDFVHHVHGLGGKQNRGANIAKMDDRRIRIEEHQNPVPENNQQRCHGHGTHFIQNQRLTGDFAAPRKIPGTVVLAHEGDRRLGEGVQDVISQYLHVKGRRGARHHIRPQAVDGRLDDQIGNGKDHTLKSRRNADSKDVLQNRTLQAEAPLLQTNSALCPAQVPKQESGADAVGQHRGQRHARHIHLQYDDKEEIQDDVQDAGNHQASQRSSGVPLTPENGCFKIIEHDKNHPHKVDSKIFYRHGCDDCRRIQQVNHGTGNNLPDAGNEHPANNRQHHGRVNGFPNPPLVLLTGKIRNNHVGTDGHPDKQVYRQRDNRTVASHRRHGVLSRKLTDYCNIRCVEELLQDTGHGQRNGKSHQLRCDASIQQIRLFFHFLAKRKDPPNLF